MSVLRLWLRRWAGSRTHWSKLSRNCRCWRRHRGIWIASPKIPTVSIVSHVVIAEDRSTAARRAAVILPRALPTASIADPEEVKPKFDGIRVRCLREPLYGPVMCLWPRCRRVKGRKGCPESISPTVVCLHVTAHVRVLPPVVTPVHTHVTIKVMLSPRRSSGTSATPRKRGRSSSSGCRPLF